MGKRKIFDMGRDIYKECKILDIPIIIDVNIDSMGFKIEYPIPYVPDVSDKFIECPRCGRKIERNYLKRRGHSCNERG
jgi:hypothetical protein